MIAEFKRSHYPNLEAPDMHLLNTSCLAEFENDTHVTFHVPFKTCGTVRIQTTDYLEYRNEIIRHIRQGIVTYMMDLNFPIICKYDRNVTMDDVIVELIADDEDTGIWVVNIIHYYMAVSHRDLELPNSRNLIGLNRFWPRSRFSHLEWHLDRLHLAVKSCKLQKAKDIGYSLLKSSNKPGEKKRKKRVKTTSKLCATAHRRLQAKCQPVRTIYIKRVKGLSFGHIIDILLPSLVSLYGTILTPVVSTDRTASGLYFTTSVKILPYSPPARLIRGKKWDLKATEFTNKGPDGIKWELSYVFTIEKLDLGYWDWESQKTGVGLGKKVIWES